MAAARGEFAISETHAIGRRLGYRPLATSQGLGWRSIYASVQTEEPYHATFEGVPDHLIVVHLSGVTSIGFVSQGRGEHQIVPVGCMSIIAAGHDFDANVGERLSTLHLYVRDSLFRDAVQEAALPDAAAIRVVSKIGVRDPVIESLAKAIIEAMESKTAIALCYIEHLAKTIAWQLLLRHSTVAIKEDPGPSGLARDQMRCVLEFIDAQLERSITTEELARLVSMSVAHFSRRFKQSTGSAPHKYVMKARVDRAQVLIRDRYTALSDIAFQCGFSHQEHFTRVFGKLVGETPAAYRRRLTAG